MTEKEMIEEISNDIRDSLKLHIGKTILYPYIANDLYNAGYRKIPEGSVVLTKEKYEKLTAPKVFISPKSLSKKEFEERIKNISNYGIIGVDESSIEIIPTRTDIKKETAKEILQRVSDTYTNDTAWTDWLNDFFGAKFKELCEENGLKAIQTENGVKVEE